MKCDGCETDISNPGMAFVIHPPFHFRYLDAKFVIEAELRFHGFSCFSAWISDMYRMWQRSNI